MIGKAYIGTSGFTYEHWRDVFYPPDVPQKRWLEFYAQHFETTELNNTFYAMPRPNVCLGWRERTPEGFCFAVKLNRLITHRKRLADSSGLLDRYLHAAGNLGEKLGPILVQLPPHWHANPQRLDEFLGICPRRHRWAVEFRDETWLCEEVFEILRKHNAALCIHDIIADHPWVVTADWLYLRYHGSGGAVYAGDYPANYLNEQAHRIGQELHAGRDVYAYFNNDALGYAVRNALDLKRLVCAVHK